MKYWKIRSVGRLTSFWDSTGQAVVLELEGIEIARWDEEIALGDVLEVATYLEPKRLSADELTFILETAYTVDAYAEHAEHDLQTYGELNVTF